jgi:hypothetical protein
MQCLCPVILDYEHQFATDTDVLRPQSKQVFLPVGVPDVFLPVPNVCLSVGV